MRIYAREHKGEMVVAVEDTGPGIPEAARQILFQEFRQVHETGTKRPEGTGLGLALVRRFVEMHGGTIRVESAPGEGSTFIVVMPIRQGAIPLPFVHPERSEGSTTAPGPTCIVRDSRHQHELRGAVVDSSLRSE